MSKIEKTLKITFSLITLIFFLASATYFYRYQNQMSKDIYSEQGKVAKLTSNALSLYFDKLKFAIENTVSSKHFLYERNIDEDQIRYKDSNDFGLLPIKNGNKKVWNYFKGLPERYKGKNVAKERRSSAKNILSNYDDVHYVFEMDLNGDLVFLEPYNVQKRITSFNYKFRDYLKLVKESKTTSISEGYISHDENRTHIITVATPIKSTETGEVKKVFAASISARTLHDRVLKSIALQLDPEQNYKISLVDRHGHIVANSSDLNNYSPTMGAANDLKDKGNIRQYEIFSGLNWKKDTFEKKNVWERETKSWILKSSKLITKDYVNNKGQKVFGTLYPVSIYKDSQYNWGVLVETPTDTFLRESNLTLMGFVVSFILIFCLLYLVYKKTLREYRKIESNVKRAEFDLKQLARKVKHDIRSPLTSIEFLFENIKPKCEEEERLIAKHSLERINDIILTLNPDKKITKKKQDLPSVEILFPLVNRVISEKRIEFNSDNRVKLRLENKLKYGVFTNIDKSNLSRTLSNLINNSVESKRDNLNIFIDVKLWNDESNCFIEIRDNGVGIEKNSQKNIFDYGVSVNKVAGKGIGLSQARDHIEKANGEISLESKVDEGTIVKISLPICHAPKWFKKELEICKKNLCIVDDDESIHLLWAKALEHKNLNLINIKNSDEFERWEKRVNLNEYEFLFDLELLGSKLSGLDIIEKFKLSNSSTLVTSHYNDFDVQKRALDLKIEIIQKDSASDIPVIINKIKDDIVLIDDDDLVHMTWKREMSKKGYKLSSYYSVKDFVTDADNFSLNTLIYIDSNLGEGLRGEVLSKEIADLGFNNLYIATGYSADSIEKPVWIKSVLGKKPNEVFLNQ